MVSAETASGGGVWGDYDNDGDLDLLVANWGAAPVLYLNDGHGAFSRARVPAFESGVAYASSLAWADLENDGDLDVVIGYWPNRPGPGEHNQLLTNSGSGGSWLKVRLVGTAANRSGLGARIVLRSAAGGVQMREVSGLTSWRSQDDLLQHFGLGESAVVPELEVRRPSGAVSRLTGVPSNEVLEIVE